MTQNSQHPGPPALVVAGMIGGRPVDRHGKIFFDSFKRLGDSDLVASDALLIGQLPITYIPKTTSVPEPLVITTPNADWLPNINLGQQTVICREDGRWGPEDWTLWPQWYFEEYNYFPYILRRPQEDVLQIHPLRLLWWDMTKAEFNEESGCALTGIGRLHEAVVEEMYGLCSSLMKDIESQDSACSPQAFSRMQDATAAMWHALITLRHLPQSFDSTRLTVVAWQRRFLAARVILDKFRIYDLRPREKRKFEIDNSIVSVVTDQPELVFDLFEKGVPVWYIRRAAVIPQDINIVFQGILTDPHPDAGVVLAHWHGAPIFYTGPRSPGMYFATGHWRPGSINLSNIGPEDWSPSSSSTAGIVPDLQHSSVARSSSQAQSYSSRLSAHRPHVKPYSRLQAVSRKESKLNINININWDRFKVPDSINSSKTTRLWAEALGSVKIETSSIIDHSQRSLFRGFAVPDGLVFLDEKHGKEYLLAWLVIRTPWMSTLTGREQGEKVLPSPQQWRTYLREIALDYELQRKDCRQHHPPTASGPTRTARWKQKVRDGAKELFTISKPSCDLLDSISWNNRTVWMPTSLDLCSGDYQLAVWDVQEHNFHVELYSLDRCIMKEAWEDPWVAGSREKKIREIFFKEATLMVSPPPDIKSIASKQPADRCLYVNAFRNLLADWPGEIPHKLADLQFRQLVNGEVVWDFKVMSMVEWIAFSFYCQTFFNYFGRAPSIPHTYPA